MTARKRHAGDAHALAEYAADGILRSKKAVTLGEESKPGLSAMHRRMTSHTKADARPKQ
jgi:hypothetical protein